MKQLFFLSALCLSILFQSQAQTVSKINFDAIKTAITSSKSKMYYPTLLKRYHANDPKLTVDEYKHLYYGWTFQSGYNPYKPNDQSDALNEMLLYERFPEIISTGKKLLATDPFNLDVMYLMHMAHGELNQQVESKKWLVKFEGLMAAIKASGNGRSKETAVVLNAPRDEYMFLTVVGLRQKGRPQLVDNAYDLVTLQTPNKLNLTELYFNIQKAVAKKR
ncbi:DUF4919 domain-containing protein [Rufibacter glacialis]|uniref:DUF4919 domain-containing protein n=1 Tax=Rufibacter glacialis TaxID=1259555 RepID=A0A5M8QPQ8_9BACT|nr:DUF4919 domain-containing protein [Rufibacter glacialis]KAA6437268.1 DUF4919 domain-containing protein [Rufibacter glacialis]GGK60551.1 hypothetical protein GCM10011405_06000 [Rufibacter glacialis]